MPEAMRYLAQAALYALLFLPLAWCTSMPLYRHQQPELATLKLAVRHAGKVIGECRSLSIEQYDNLPANMKRPQVCPRERSPLRLSMRVDGDYLYRDTVAAAGLHHDGVSSMYRRFSLPAGRHHLQLSMNDDVASEGPTAQLQRDIELTPAQVLVITFAGEFRLQ